MGSQLSAWSMDEYIDPLLAEQVPRLPKFMLQKEFAKSLRDFQAVVPQGHGLDKRSTGVLECNISKHCEVD